MHSVPALVVTLGALLADVPHTLRSLTQPCRDGACLGSLLISRLVLNAPLTRGPTGNSSAAFMPPARSRATVASPCGGGAALGRPATPNPRPRSHSFVKLEGLVGVAVDAGELEGRGRRVKNVSQRGCPEHETPRCRLSSDSSRSPRATRRPGISLGETYARDLPGFRLATSRHYPPS